MSQTEQEKHFIQIVTQCDQLIKSGQITEAIQLIKTLNMAEVPRKLRLELAYICRRVGLIGHGLRILHSVIRNGNTSFDSPTDSEKCEYAVLLVRNASVEEASTLLEKVNVTNAPQAWLYKSFCHIAHWEYSTAVGYLENFLKADPEPYMKLVAQVNLASSLIVTSRLDEAAELLRETLLMAEKAQALRLAGNCYELWGQLHFWRHDYSNARKALQKAIEILSSSPGYDMLLIHKTQAIISALESRSLEPLIKFRKEAFERKHWESVRESDLFSLKVQFDQDRLDHLIYGTPFAPYRHRIQEIAGREPSAEYILGNSNSRCLDLQTGLVDNSESLSPGKKIHQVIASLVRDFYSPRNIGSLFSELYPGEYFDIQSSPGRIRQLMLRTRQWLQENQIPASIEQSDGTYSLALHGDFGIRMSLQKFSLDSFELKWKELQKTFSGSESFTAAKACEKLSCSRTSFRRLVDWALEKGFLEKSGSGPSTSYRILGPQMSDQMGKAC